MRKYLEQLQRYRTDPGRYACDELAIIIIKPNSTPESCSEIMNLIAENKLEVIKTVHTTLTKAKVLAVYNDIFRFNENDLLFGIGWKDRKMKYMTSNPVEAVLVQGIYAQQKAENIKYIIRQHYGKLSVPNTKLDDDTFEELAIKNIIHVVDSDETDISLRLFFS